MKNIIIPPISKFSVVCFFLFLLFTILLRGLLPFGDEPDFVVRASRLALIDEHVFFSPYRLLENLVSLIDRESFCQISNTPLSLIASIGASSCMQDLDQITYRVLLSTLIMIPLFFICVFRNFNYIWINKVSGISGSNYLQKLDTLSLSTITLSYIYYVGVIGYEQFMLMLVTFIFICINNVFLTLLLFLMVFAIDIGDSVILLAFVVFYYIFRGVSDKSFRSSFVILIIIASIALIAQYSLLHIVSNISILAEKSAAMIAKNESLYSVRDKYPVLLRPIITYMSMVFFTPNYLKSVISYVLVLPILLYSFKGVYTLSKSSLDIIGSELQEQYQEMFTGGFASLATILFFVFMFPDYANGKYYIFLLPFFLVFPVHYFGKINVIYFLVSVNFLILSEFSLGYLN